MFILLRDRHQLLYFSKKQSASGVQSTVLKDLQSILG